MAINRFASTQPDKAQLIRPLGSPPVLLQQSPPGFKPPTQEICYQLAEMVSLVKFVKLYFLVTSHLTLFGFRFTLLLGTRPSWDLPFGVKNWQTQPEIYLFPSLTIAK